MEPTSIGYITDVTYTDNYYGQLCPVTLNYIAALNGHSFPDLSDFDYCELGCGMGLSLLMHAAANPGGRFVGIDLNPEHIRHAEAAARELKLANVSLRAQSVGDALDDPQLPMFDFVVMHGLYSWVPEYVRGEIQSFLRSRLKPGGIAFITYNAMPGCAGKAPLREMMKAFATPLSSNSIERAELGLSYLRLLLNGKAPFFQLNPNSARHAENLFDKDLRYVAHEYLNDEWHPLYFAQAEHEMREAGLVFAGGMPMWTNYPEADTPPNMDEFFSSLPSRSARETHRDFVLNTVFRSDVFIRPANAADGRSLLDMSFGNVTRPDQLQTGEEIGFFTPPLADETCQTVLKLIQDNPLALTELIASAAKAGIAPERTLKALSWWVLSGQIRPACPSADNPGFSAVNAALVLRAMRDPETSMVWLASQRYGTAFEMEKTQALALWAVSLARSGPREESLLRLLKSHRLTADERGQALSDSRIREMCTSIFAELDAVGATEHAHRIGIL